MEQPLRAVTLQDLLGTGIVSNSLLCKLLDKLTDTPPSIITIQRARHERLGVWLCGRNTQSNVSRATHTQYCVWVAVIQLESRQKHLFLCIGTPPLIHSKGFRDLGQLRVAAEAGRHLEI